MKKYFLMSLVAIVAVTMTSCMSVNFNDNGADKTPTQVSAINQVTAMQPFDEVDIAGAFKIVYEQGSEHSVRVEASEQELKEMTVYVKDGELRIRKAVKKPTVSFKNVKVFVTSPNLQKIELAGSGMFAASNAISVANDLDVEIAGSGNVLLTSVSCHDSDLEIAGSGNIEIGELTVNEVSTEIAGSGNINLGAMTCKKLDAEIAGSGDINCDKIDAESAHVEIAGSGDVNFKGRILNITKEIAGSGKVNYVETAPADTIQ